MDVETRVKKIISDSLRKDITELSPDSNFIKDLQADSLDVVEMVVALEREFNLEIANDDAENMKTIGAVFNYLRQQGHA